MFSSLFLKKPHNYKQIDSVVSRSAQPGRKNLKWLKNQGVTDIVNLREGKLLDFNERLEVEKLGMHYHHIPTNIKEPKETDVGKFLDLVEGVSRNGGKVHIHCAYGADRTGMYSWIYKQRNGMGEMRENEQEMLDMGYDYVRHPMLVHWIKDYLYQGFEKFRTL